MTREEVRHEIAAFARVISGEFDKAEYPLQHKIFSEVAAQLEANPPEPVKLNPCVQCGHTMDEPAKLVYDTGCIKCGNTTDEYPTEAEADAAWNAANPVTPEKQEPVYDLGAEFRDRNGVKWILFENPWTGCCTLMDEDRDLVGLKPHVDQLPLTKSELFEHPEEWTPIP